MLNRHTLAQMLESTDSRLQLALKTLLLLMPFVVQLTTLIRSKAGRVRRVRRRKALRLIRRHDSRSDGS